MDHKSPLEEQLFVLKASDITAPYAVLEWIKLNLKTKSDDELRRAFEAALKMKNDYNAYPNK